MPTCRKIRLTDISIQGHFKIYSSNYLITDVLADDDFAFFTALDKLTDDFDSFIWIFETIVDVVDIAMKVSQLAMTITLRGVFKLMLVKWHFWPIKSSLFGNQPIRTWAESINLKTGLRSFIWMTDFNRLVAIGAFKRFTDVFANSDETIGTIALNIFVKNFNTSIGISDSPFLEIDIITENVKITHSISWEVEGLANFLRFSPIDSPKTINSSKTIDSLKTIDSPKTSIDRKYRFT